MDVARWMIVQSCIGILYFLEICLPIEKVSEWSLMIVYHLSLFKPSSKSCTGSDIDTPSTSTQSANYSPPDITIDVRHIQ